MFGSLRGYRISIIPRGQAAGYVLSFPEEDRGLVSREWFTDFIVIALGGRVAEELIFNEITSGARDDLDKTTQIARQMVTRYGMSDALGPMVYGRKEELVFLGRELSEQRDYSEAVAKEIDYEVKPKRNVITGYVGVRKGKAYYGYFQELGTRFHAAHPFLRPAVPRTHKTQIGQAEIGHDPGDGADIFRQLGLVEDYTRGQERDHAACISLSRDERKRSHASHTASDPARPAGAGRLPRGARDAQPHAEARHQAA